MKIPLVDLKANYLSIKEKIDSAISNVINDTAFIGGKYVQKFEEEFAAKIKAKYCVFCSSGTSALQLAYLAHHIENKGIITTSNTFIATAEAAESLASEGVECFVDVNENGLINIDLLEQKLWDSSRFVVVPVHLYGQVVDVDLIKSKYNVEIIEDAAQAHFARYKDGSYVGSKDTTCFSFFPGKNLGGFGDSGALVTNNEDIYKYAKMYRDHGRKSKFESEIVGSNLRGDGIQAAILSVKLQHILEWNEKRKTIAKKYNEYLKDIKEIKTPVYDGNFVYHLYVIQELTSRRDELKKHLEDSGISCGIHYPVPIHKQKAFNWASESNLPITEMLASQILSLPIYPELLNEQIEYICEKVREFYV
jgi:dTDP-4-amino-4,6-dideoxygalactose transaminase